MMHRSTARRSRWGAVLIVLGLVAATLAIMPGAGAADMVTVGSFGGTYYWSSVSINGGPAGGGWCVDTSTTLSPGTYPVSSMALLGIPQVDWILNEYPSGALSGYSMCDIQNAIWSYTGQQVGGSGCTNPGNYLAVKAAAEAAVAGGWAPGCGDLLAMKVVPQGKQAVIFPVARTCNGQIRVTKLATGDAPPAFSFQASWDGDGFALTNGQTEGPITLATGDSGVALWVEETPVPAGWGLSSFECRDAAGALVGAASSDPAHPNRWELTLTTGADVTCTFTNEQRGRIIIEKRTLPDGSPGSFTFRPSYGSSFSLSDGQTEDSGLLRPGTYSVSESVPPGWDLTGLVCDDPDGSSSVSLATASATIDLDAGEAVRCTFTNSRRGRIIVEKDVPAGSPNATFLFDPSWGASFSLAGGQATGAVEVPAGVHSVAELMPLAEGWALIDAYCSDGSEPNAIGVSPGETVTCTFENVYDPGEGYLRVVKVVDGGGAACPDFSFALDGGAATAFDGDCDNLFALPVGSIHSVAEVLAADAYLAEYDNCTDVSIVAGQTAVCTITNTYQQTGGATGSLTIIKDAAGAGTLEFEFVGTTGEFQLADGESVTFDELEAGSYLVSELTSGDWEFVEVSCQALDWQASVDGASVTVSLGAGESAVCTFVNGSTAGPGDLPYTGSAPYTLPALIAGLGAVLLGLVMLVLPKGKKVRG